MPSLFSKNQKCPDIRSLLLLSLKQNKSLFEEQQQSVLVFVMFLPPSQTGQQ